MPYEAPTPRDTQHVFDVTAEHLLRQGRKSQEPDGRECLYRGPDGTMCAAGIWLSDADDPSGLEGIPVPQVLEYVEDADRGRRLRCTAVYLLLDDLQYLHDNWAVVKWPRELRRVAKKHGLNDQVVDRVLADLQQCGAGLRPEGVGF